MSKRSGTSSQKKRNPTGIKEPISSTPQKTKGKRNTEKASPLTDPKKEDCICGRHQEINGVSYRYPKGIATSYQVSYLPKESQKQISYFNYNTYNPKQIDCKMDLRTVNKVFLIIILFYLQVDFGPSEFLSKSQVWGEMPSKANQCPEEKLKSTYEVFTVFLCAQDQYPNWGKPDYFHFKHKELRVTSDKLPFQGKTTYNGFYDSTEKKPNQDFLWSNADIAYI